MNNKYQKQDNHKTDKWGNIITDKKFTPRKNNTNSSNSGKCPPINNPFIEALDQLFPGLKKEVDK